MTLTQLPSPVIAHHGPWRFTCQPQIDEEYIQQFFDLYEIAFAPLVTLSAARQVLTHEEFQGQMQDPSVDKYIAWDDASEPIGLITLTNNLLAIPWISPQFFAARYPEQWARNAFYYLGFALAHPSMRHQRFVETMIAVGMEKLQAERAVMAYDVCAFNNQALRFADRIDKVIGNNPAIRLEVVDSEVYYAVEFL